MLNVNSIQNKKGKEPIVMLTAYSAPTAAICHEAGVDMLLVGDSLAMTFLGLDSTLPVGVDEMCLFASAVRRGAPAAFVVADMPFGSYGIDYTKSVANALRFVKEAGASAVKLEGANENVLSDIKAMRAIGIEVMGHIGLTPQSLVHRSGYKVQGREEDDRARLLQEAEALQSAGCFSVVLECVPEPLGRDIAAGLDIPVIGIGAGRYVDGQVLVFDDVVGFFDKFRPKFVKSYADSWNNAITAVKAFVEDVRKKEFPGEGHVYE